MYCLKNLGFPWQLVWNKVNQIPVTAIFFALFLHFHRGLVSISRQSGLLLDNEK